MFWISKPRGCDGDLQVLYRYFSLVVQTYDSFVNRNAIFQVGSDLSLSFIFVSHPLFCDRPRRARPSGCFLGQSCHSVHSSLLEIYFERPGGLLVECLPYNLG